LLHEQDAEDVVQEVFVYVFRSLHQYDPKRGSFSTWLYTITVSRSRNARRRKVLPTIDLGSLLQIGLEPVASDEESPEAAVMRNDANRVLFAALTKLSPRLREAVVLRYGKQLTYREMSAILNCPEKTAESRVRLAHAALRDAMKAADYHWLEQLLPL
jgi:RNA polymerase sigma-70 factor (ECF subfamily)